MTTSDTMSAPLTSPSAPADAAREAGHEHSWTTESRHPTSAGHVLYVRCTGCGAHRVDLQARTDAPPAPLSRAVGATERTARRSAP
ncbi:hypothetical protein [Promicromonospora sukumoe]|uniref:Uncharacterized protein n=1 Tax=Promicromonospora sukumoe TaxID=88382 RepID=A0A7W3J9W6_9MICO|nr:hypothetical protein [Promicromonospora sukumoe]MBA8808986.1 hypothetical protein [Promicromonospora sukumoe]